MKAALFSALVLLMAPAVSFAAGTEACDHAYAPFASVPGASLAPVDFVSKDEPPVVYTMWRGVIPSFDGLPLSVDVTIPAERTVRCRSWR